MIHLPRWLRVTIVGTILLGIAAAIAWREYSHPESVADFVGEWRGAAPLVFIAAHVVASLLFIPRTPLALAAGAVFGAWWGTVWALAGAMGGALCGFCIARYVNDGLVDVEHLPRLGPLLERAESGGWRFAMVVRLLPFLPHALTNYAFGLTRMPLGAYALGSLLGMAPQALAYARLGEAGATAAQGGAGWLEPLFWGLVLLGLSLVLPRLLAARRR